MAGTVQQQKSKSRNYIFKNRKIASAERQSRKQILWGTLIKSVCDPLWRLLFSVPRRVSSIWGDGSVHTVLCSFSGGSAFGHGWFPLHRWGLEGRMLPPPPKLEVNELPHHEGLCDANGGQDGDPDCQHIEVSSTKIQLLILCSCQAKTNSEDRKN